MGKQTSMPIQGTATQQWKKLSIDTWNSIDGSQSNYAGWKKPVEEYILYNFTCLKF